MIRYYLGNTDRTLEKATDGASGYDLRADVGTVRILEPGARWLVPTGLYLEMPRGVEAQVRSRSGLSIHHGVVVLNAPGTVDSDYRGEVKITLINLGQQPYEIVPGERIAQLVFAPVFPDHIYVVKDGPFLTRVSQLSELSDTKRGAGGHGSTGR